MNWITEMFCYLILGLFLCLVTLVTTRVWKMRNWEEEPCSLYRSNLDCTLLRFSRDEWLEVAGNRAILMKAIFWQSSKREDVKDWLIQGPSASWIFYFTVGSSIPLACFLGSKFKGKYECMHIFSFCLAFTSSSHGSTPVEGRTTEMLNSGAHLSPLSAKNFTTT